MPALVKNKEVDAIAVAEKKVNDPGATAFAPAACRQSDFAHTTASFEQVALFGMACELELKSSVVMIADDLPDQPRKRGRFDEGQQTSRV